MKRIKGVERAESLAAVRARSTQIERLVQYAERYYAKNGGWPTVRRAAQALRRKQWEIADYTEESDELCLDSYNVHPPLPVGDSEVYSMRGSVKR